MERRTFLKIGAGTAGAMLVPVFGNAIAAEELLSPMAAQPSRRPWPTPP
jgi:TldD protein